jgi:hypothetical protein
LGGSQPNLCIGFHPASNRKSVILGAVTVTPARALDPIPVLRGAYDQATAFVSKFYQQSDWITPLPLLKLPELAKDMYVLARSAPGRPSGLPSARNHISVVDKRRSASKRAALGAAGIVFVLMAVAIGVLTLRFMLIFAYSFLR